MIDGASISILVTAKDNASKVLQGVQKEANSLSKSLGTGLKLAGLGAAAGIGAAGYALVGFVKKAAQEQVGIKRLETAIMTLDEAHKGAAASVEEVVRASEKLAFSDDEVRNSIAKLIPATGDYDEAVRRLSIAQDLARGTGMDLETASKLVGKVSEDNIQVLKRYGVTLRDGATEQEALAEIQKKFGGQAAGYAETATAKWAIFNNQIDNIQESIGAALLPTVTKLGGALSDFLIDHQPDIDRFSQSLSEKIPQAIDAIVKAIEPHLPALKAFGADVLQGWQDIITTLQPKLKELGDWLKDNQPIAIALGVAIAGVVAIMIGWPAILLAVAIAAGALTAKMEELRQENEDLDEVLTALGATIGPLSVAIKFLAEESMREWRIVIFFVAEALRGLQTITGFVRTEIDFLRSAFDRAKDVAYWFKDALYSVRDAAYAVRDAINSIPSFGDVPVVGGIVRRLADGNPFNARGTNFWSGGPTWVGEEGPEIVDVPRGARIRSNQASMAAVGGGGNNYTISVHVQGDATDRTVDRIKQELQDVIARAAQISGLGGGFPYEGAFING